MSVLVNTKYNKLGSINELASELAKIVDENTVFVCVGTDRIIGDSLGPIVGSLLQDRIPNKVYGTVEYPVHALNVNEIGKTIKEEHEGTTIVAIDACIGVTIPKGNIRLLQITEKQYEQMLMLRGIKKDDEKESNNSMIIID